MYALEEDKDGCRVPLLGTNVKAAICLLLLSPSREHDVEDGRGSHEMF